MPTGSNPRAIASPAHVAATTSARATTSVRATASWRHGRLVFAVVVAAMVAVSGCATRKPAAEPEPPALAVPVVPPRVLAPLPDLDAPPVEVAETEEPATPSRPQRPSTRPRSEPPRDAGKPDTPSDPGATPPPDVKPAEPATPLRTPQTANDQQAERRIREALGRAAKALSQVNVGNLGRDARQQYDSARRFVDQAEGALEAGNYMFASYLAEKAEALARGLAGR